MTLSVCVNEANGVRASGLCFTVVIYAADAPLDTLGPRGESAHIEHSERTWHTPTPVYFYDAFCERTEPRAPRVCFADVLTPTPSNPPRVTAGRNVVLEERFGVPQVRSGAP